MERLKRRQFTAEFKLEAARYVLDQGMSFAEVGKRLGVLPKLVRDWVVKYEAGELVAGAPKLRVTPEQMELSELRQEVQRLRMERDILKKAAVSSTGQCNAGRKFIGRCAKAQRLPRALIQTQSDLVQVRL